MTQVERPVPTPEDPRLPYILMKRGIDLADYGIHFPHSDARFAVFRNSPQDILAVSHVKADAPHIVFELVKEIPLQEQYPDEQADSFVSIRRLTINQDGSMNGEGNVSLGGIDQWISYQIAGRVGQDFTALHREQVGDSGEVADDEIIDEDLKEALLSLFNHQAGDDSSAPVLDLRTYLNIVKGFVDQACVEKAPSKKFLSDVNDIIFDTEIENQNVTLQAV